VEKSFDEIKVVIIGIGAAGVSIIKMLQVAGVKHIIAVDREGAICDTNTYTNSVWTWVSRNTNSDRITGNLSEVIQGADVFIGVSGKDVLKVSDIKLMANDPIVFAMANPDPEIEHDLAEPHVRVLATGRSDYPNQINNVLCFPWGVGLSSEDD
jgi:malate dehydrogenase (oxaloacetate-decarboxylating)